MKTYPRWPLAVIALPAGVAVWSGWVSLGLMCGFGNVELLPGIVSWHLNTAITLPVGTEVYAAYALGAWLSSRTPDRAKTFAKRSALASLGMGLLAQIAYHLLASHGVHVAPWPVTVLVSSVPVSMLFMGAMLAHLMHGDAEASTTVSTTEPEALTASVTTPEVLSAESTPEASENVTTEALVRSTEPLPVEAPTEAALEAVPEAPTPAKPKAPKGIKGSTPRKRYAALLADGKYPSIRQVQADYGIGYPKAKAIVEELKTPPLKAVSG